MCEISVDGNGELSGAFGFDPADELNQQIADQNARAAQIEAIGDPQFAALALSGLRQEADEAFALMASEPYEELGARGLEDEREAVTAETILQ